MERNYHTHSATLADANELNWRTAFHEAGHTAGIHIRNQQMQLPPVFFEILVKKPQDNLDHFFAKVIEGNLIQNIPIAMLESFSQLSGHTQHSCQRAYEADIINLLIGPLAEAKYIAERDNETFKQGQLTADTLYNYGGFSDLEMVQNYLDSFIADKALRAAKFEELFNLAFKFINNRKNWHSVVCLAQYIIDCKQEIISCDEAISVLDNGNSLYDRKSNLNFFFH